MAETILSAPTNQAASPPHTLTARRIDHGASMQQLIYFREILRYVPQYRDKVFVIALDGAIVSDPNFQNLLLDIALLRSLSIGVVLVHGAGHQILQLADQSGEVAETFPHNLLMISDQSPGDLRVSCPNNLGDSAQRQIQIAQTLDHLSVDKLRHAITAVATDRSPQAPAALARGNGAAP